MSNSFLDNLDSFTLASLQEAIAYRLFDDWVNNFDGDQFELDYQIASGSRSPMVRDTFNNHYNLLPGNEHYLQ